MLVCDRVSTLLLAFLLLAHWAWAATANASQRLPLLSSQGKQHWLLPDGVAQGQRLLIQGNVKGDASVSQRLLIRIDTAHSHHYQSRFNLELLFGNGPFDYQLDLDQLRTGAKQPFSSLEIRQLYVVPLDEGIHFQQIQLQAKPKAPEGIIGWDFGAKQQTPAWGFTPVDPSYTHIATPTQAIQLAGPVRVRDRPYFDDLIRDGIEGLTELRLPLANGLWHLRLWTEEIGEWEYLPHVLKRRIEINGQVADEQQLTYAQWVQSTYLSSLAIYDHQADVMHLQQQFWQQIGMKRGRPIEHVVAVTQGQLHLKFSSPDAAGRFISALIAVPIQQGSHKSESVLQQFDALRAQQFKNHWPVLNNPKALQTLPPSYRGESLPVADQEKLLLHLYFEQDLPPLSQVQLPVKALQIYQVRQQLRRVGGQEQALHQETILSPLPLEALNSSTLQPKAGEHWLIMATVDQSDGAYAHQQKPKWGLQFGSYLYPIDLQLINIRLPNANIPVGIYLDYAPHLMWFDPAAARQQSQCDYRLLQQLGLTGVAPALPTPVPQQETAFKQAVQQPLLAGLLPPFPAYTPVKRLIAQQGQATSVEQLAKLSAVSPLLLWSLADEPGLHPEQDQQLQAFGEHLHQVLPQAKRMAQLNQRQHETLLANYEAVLVNQGYGLTPDRLHSLQQQGKSVYLYNLPNLRYAAGYYLWRTQAKGFWQWHGRMPTAHPFDPTDGREDDVQFLLPSATLCGATALNSRLVSLVRGIEDLRWLSWLSQQALQDIDAALLQQEIMEKISLDWSAEVPASQLDQLTARIKQLWGKTSDE